MSEPEDQREAEEPTNITPEGERAEIDFALVFERIATALEQIAYNLKLINKKFK